MMAQGGGGLMARAADSLSLRFGLPSMEAVADDVHPATTAAGPSGEPSASPAMAKGGGDLIDHTAPLLPAAATTAAGPSGEPSAFPAMAQGGRGLIDHIAPLLQRPPRRRPGHPGKIGRAHV